MSDTRSFFPTLARSALVAALWVGLCPLAVAEGNDRPRGPQAPLLPSYKAECAACHIAYPPGMLPAASWQRLMRHLPKHFGSDASLDPALAQEIGAWLSANSAESAAESATTGRRATESPPEDRITRSGWFTREHDEVPAATWQRPSIRSASNCAACHTTADQGDFNEHRIRIPR